MAISQRNFILKNQQGDFTTQNLFLNLLVLSDNDTSIIELRFFIWELILKTRRLGNVRLHIRFRPPLIHSTILWHDCLKNEEQMEKPQKFKYFPKNWCMIENIASTDWWNTPILRKPVKTNSKIKQQQQKLITIKKSKSVLKIKT